MWDTARNLLTICGGARSSLVFILYSTYPRPQEPSPHLVPPSKSAASGPGLGCQYGNALSRPLLLPPPPAVCIFYYSVVLSQTHHDFEAALLLRTQSRRTPTRRTSVALCFRSYYQLCKQVRRECREWYAGAGKWGTGGPSAQP